MYGIYTFPGPYKTNRDLQKRHALYIQLDFRSHQCRSCRRNVPYWRVMSPSIWTNDWIYRWWWFLPLGSLENFQKKPWRLALEFLGLMCWGYLAGDPQVLYSIATCSTASLVLTSWENLEMDLWFAQNTLSVFRACSTNLDGGRSWVCCDVFYQQWS